MICRLFVVVAALGALAPHSPDTKVAKAEKAGLEQEVGDISGYYTCRGVETGGKAYSGVAVISKKNEVYVVSGWWAAARLSPASASARGAPFPRAGPFPESAA